MSRLRQTLCALGVVALAATTLGAGAATAAPTGPAGPSAPAASHALIQGSGSSWSANAVNQWISDVHASGLQVVFTSNGSAIGRKDFANKTVDYAVSDIGYQGTDSATQSGDTAQGRPYAYLPIVAGGTSFPYQLHGRGNQLITNLRLSGQTLADIFTQKIHNWNDPEIAKDNPQVTLPNLKIIPVVHSEGSGSSYQFTAYLNNQYGSQWQSFSGGGATEYFPLNRGNEVSESGSDSMINFVTSKAGNGSIGYDEYSYALGKNYPVAKVLNKGGYYTLPNQYNVAVALTKAIINDDPSSPNYLLQDLHQVYVDSDARTYPLSSYSYMIIPTGTNAQDKQETTAKRQTIADYLYYSICQGQKETGPIGYSPLTANLVQAGFSQIAKLKQADSGVDLNNESISTCNNPTFVAGQPDANYLAKVAPQPPSCDHTGSTQCATAGSTGQANPVNGKVATTGDTAGAAGSSGSAGASGSGSGGGSGGTGSGSAAGGTAANGASGGSSTDAFGGSGSGTTTADGSSAQTLATEVPAGNGSGVPIAVVAALLLLVLLAGPPIAGLVLSRRSR